MNIPQRNRILSKNKELQVAISRLKRVETACIKLPDEEVTKVKLIDLIADEALAIQKEISTFEGLLEK